MAHNGDSRIIPTGARIDKLVEKKLKRISNDWGIPPCTLGAVCIYIGFRQVEQLETKINNVVREPLPAGLPKVIQNEKDGFFTPFSDLFGNDSIPQKLSKEIMVSLKQKAKEIEQNTKKVEVEENE
jgi:hypothetical protein